MSNLYEEVTVRIIAVLEAGAPPWRKPWSATPGLNIPQNAITRRPYSGINVLLLWIARDRGWATPRFLTIKQANSVGGRVRKGEHGIGICKWGEWTPHNVSDDGGDEGDRKHSYLKRFTVFNVEQCEGLPAEIADPPPSKPRHGDERDPIIEEFLAHLGVDIREEGDRAVYVIKDDRILIPPFATFKNGGLFYATEFHELGHWVCCERRLNWGRNLKQRFPANQLYVVEELIVELTAAFLCAEFSVDCGSEHASYMGHYVKLLRADSKAIFTCASIAQKAIDYLRELALREPAHRAAE